MLTIGQLAACSGTTVAAVRHYHKVGLLPQPQRDRSGYRSYDAAAVVRLIRIRTLAAAGVPLAQVEALLDAEPETFAERVGDIDRELQERIAHLQDTRDRLARLAAGDQLALPESVLGYLERLRAIGMGQRYLDLERDAWIVVAAQVPDRIDDVMAQKHLDLEHPDVMQFYELVDGAFEWVVDDPRIASAADILDRISRRAIHVGEHHERLLEEHVAAVLDAAMIATSPAARQLITLLQQRGWTGFTELRKDGASVPDQAGK